MPRSFIAVERSGLQHYLKQINEAPLLTADEEKSLGRCIQRAKEVDDLFRNGECSLLVKEEAESEANVARERMIRSNLRLVVNIAKGYSHRGMMLADLVEEGNLGLLRAVEGFDPAQNTRFSTYASWWIKQAIKRALINSVQPIHIPAYMVEMVAKWKQAQKEFQDREGRHPTIKELAVALGLPEKKVRIIKRAVKAISSPTQTDDAETGLSLSEMLADQKTPAPDEAVFSVAESEMLQRLLDQIDEREATILRLRFGFDDGESLTLKEIGERIGLTRERVRQIERDALNKLNALIAEEYA
jgi:RNA polymerase primary sigma factor